MEMKLRAFDKNGNVVHTLLKWVTDPLQVRAYVQCQRNNPRTVAVQYNVDGTIYPAVYFPDDRDVYEPDTSVFNVYYNPQEIMSRTVQ